MRTLLVLFITSLLVASLSAKSYPAFTVRINAAKDVNAEDGLVKVTIRAVFANTKEPAEGTVTVELSPQERCRCLESGKEFAKKTFEMTGDASVEFHINKDFVVNAHGFDANKVFELEATFTEKLSGIKQIARAKFTIHS